MTETPTRSSQILAQLRKMCASPVFADAGRVRPLLEYLVQAVVGGTADRLSQRSIATEVFGRDEPFDPKCDAIVRVEIGRLRNKLREYYATDGSADTLLVDVPKGKYEPEIRPRPPNPPSSAVNGRSSHEFDGSRDAWAYMAEPETIGTPAEREVVITRVCRAPREHVYEAWTNPEQLRQWYRVPGWALVACEMDIRVGGICRLVTRHPDGMQVVQRCVIKELTPGERIVHMEHWDGTSADDMLVEITFRQERENTTLTVTVQFPTRAARQAFVASGLLSQVNAVYDRLAELVSSRQIGAGREHRRDPRRVSGSASRTSRSGDTRSTVSTLRTPTDPTRPADTADRHIDPRVSIARYRERSSRRS